MKIVVLALILSCEVKGLSVLHANRCIFEFTLIGVEQPKHTSLPLIAQEDCGHIESLLGSMALHKHHCVTIARCTILMHN